VPNKPGCGFIRHFNGVDQRQAQRLVLLKVPALPPRRQSPCGLA